MPAQNLFMQQAIEEARTGITLNHGGPFGCVIVKDGKVIGSGHNMVLISHDPTAHGEVSAIRATTAKLGTHDLSGCALYTTGEPCPMCLCACMWANIATIYYGCTIEDNELIGFRDKQFDTLMDSGRKNLGGYLKMIDRDACLELFKEYLKLQRPSY